MGYQRPEWDEHYRQGKGFRPPSEAERVLLNARLPARAGAVALEVGCGLGDLARHLASMGYRVDAVDYAPAAIATAASAGCDPDVVFLCRDIEHDALVDLPHDAYDLIAFRLSYAFLRDRTRVMNRLRERLRPGGAVCVITPLAEAVPGHKRAIALDAEEIAHLIAGWTRVERYAADDLAFLVLRDPRPTPVTLADKRKPTPHALTGAGVVVTDGRGRVLLGWSVRGVWELPGGKPAIGAADSVGESFEETAVRELQEETGLTARVEDARLLAIWTDATHGIPRLTAAVRVTAFRGEPVVTEPHLIRRWEWHEVADLPALGQALFLPSAQVLRTVWPGLLPNLPPAACRPLAHRPRREDPAHAREAARARHALADRLREQGFLTDPAVEAAFRRVPRHILVPEAGLETVYAAADAALITQRDPHGAAASSISAPWLQAVMLQQAGLGPGDTGLEIGSGGVNAALMQEVVGPGGRVVSMDIDPVIVERAGRFLAEAGYGHVAVLLGDGEHGAPEHVPHGGFDAVIVTAEARDIPPAWVEQLAEGGRLVVPLRIHGYTWAIAFDKRDGHLVSTSFTVCGFVPMRGAGRREDVQVVLRGGEIRLLFADGRPADTSGLEEALEMRRVARWTGVAIPGSTPVDMLLLWLATTMDGFCRLAVDEDLDTGVVQTPKGRDAAAVVRDGSLAHLVTRKLDSDPETGIPAFEFGVHAYGPQADALAEAMAAAVTAWDRDMGRDSRPRLIVRPRSIDVPPAPGARVVDKQSARLEVLWQADGQAVANR